MTRSEGGGSNTAKRIRDSAGNVYNFNNLTDTELLQVSGNSITSTPPGGGGGIIGSDAAETASFIAVVGRMHRVSLASASVVVTNPEASASKFFGVFLETDHATNTLTVDGFEFLINAGESMLMYSDGTSWFRFNMHLIACRAHVYRSTVQLIPNSTLTLISFDLEKFDKGSIGRPGTAPILIRRDGQYQIGGSCALGGVLDDTEFLTADLFINGASHRQRSFNYSTAANDTMTVQTVVPETLVATNTIGLRVQHTEGSAQNTSTSQNIRPKLWVHEVL